jgi:hypothetical protein
MANLYCSKCRDELRERIARFKASTDDTTNVSVLCEIRTALFECVCNRCGHTWKSKSKAADLKFKQLLLTRK